MAISPDLLFCALQLWYLIFQKRSRHDNNYEYMLLEDIQHSHPHINLYREVIFFSWGGRILRKVESLMMILFYSPLTYFSLTSAGLPTMLLCSSDTETCNKNFGFFGVAIKKDIKTIIFNWRLHNLRMIYNSMVKGLSDVWFIFVRQRHHTLIFYCLMLWLSCNKHPNISFMFDIKCLCKFTEWFSCPAIFSRHIWVRCHRTVVRTYFRCLYHYWFNHCILMLLILTFTCVLVWLIDGLQTYMFIQSTVT